MFVLYQVYTEEPGDVFANKQPSDDQQRFDLQRRAQFHEAV